MIIGRQQLCSFQVCKEKPGTLLGESPWGTAQEDWEQSKHLLQKGWLSLLAVRTEYAHPRLLEMLFDRGFLAQLLLFRWHHPSRPTKMCRGSRGRARRSAPAATSAQCGDGNFLGQRWFQTAEGKTCPARTSQFQPATWGKRDNCS